MRRTSWKFAGAALIGLAALTMGQASADTITIQVGFITNFTFFETSPQPISLGTGPVLNLTYGNIYVFNVLTPGGDPFFLSTDISATRNPGSQSASQFLLGITGNDISNGTITIDALNHTFPTLSYMSGVHGIVDSNLIFFSAPAAVPGPIVGAGLPGLTLAAGGLQNCRERLICVLLTLRPSPKNSGDARQILREYPLWRGRNHRMGRA